MAKRNAIKKACGAGAAAVLGVGIGGCPGAPTPEQPPPEPTPITNTATEPTPDDATTEDSANATSSGPLPGGPGYASPTRYAVLHPKRIVNA